MFDISEIQSMLCKVLASQDVWSLSNCQYYVHLLINVEGSSLILVFTVRVGSKTDSYINFLIFHIHLYAKTTNVQFSRMPFFAEFWTKKPEAQIE